MQLKVGRSTDATDSAFASVAKDHDPRIRFVSMNPTLFRALVGLVPAGMLLSVVRVVRERKERLVAATGHRRSVFERGCARPRRRRTTLVSFDGMGPSTCVGHFIDLWSAIFGVTLFPTGYLFHALARVTHTTP